MSSESIFMTIWHCYLSERACFPGNLVILPKKASCERFAIKHIRCAGKIIKVEI